MMRTKNGRLCCGARRKRDGEPCEGGVVPGRTRCRFHGGMSTGPRTPEGKARSFDNLRQWRERMKATTNGD